MKARYSAAYLGTFDPLTVGHLDVIARACLLFDRLVVGVGRHQSKRPCLDEAERVAMLVEAVAPYPNVEVRAFDGLAATFARAQNVQCLIRGLRSEGDYHYEMQMAMINQALDPSLETLFIPTRPELSHISSTLVKEVIALGGEVPHLVPEHIYAPLCARLRQTPR